MNKSEKTQFSQVIRDEEFLISGILINPTEIFRAVDHINAKDFLDDGLGLLFSTMQVLLAANVPLSTGNVTAELVRANVIEKIGGIGRVAQLLKDGAPGHVQYYSERVAKHSQVRRLKGLLGSVSDGLKDPNADPGEIVEQLMNGLASVSVSGGSVAKDAGDIVDAELDRLEGFRTRGETSILSTGIACVDRALGGGLPVGLTVLGARPNIGKSAVSLEIACRVAKRGEQVLFVSIEMPHEQSAHRLLARQTGIPVEVIQKNSYDENDVPRLLKAVSEIKKLKLKIWEAPGVNAARIEGLIRSCKVKHGVSLVIVDYLQMVSGEGNLYEKTTRNSGAFATMAKRLKVPILLLAQLNREAENEEPQLHHLRDSGAIEQDADLVCFLHRFRDDEDSKFIVAKARQTSVRTTALRIGKTRVSDPNEEFANDFPFSGGAS